MQERRCNNQFLNCRGETTQRWLGREREDGIYQKGRSPEPLNGSFWRRGDYAVMKGALKIITGDSRQIYTRT